MTGSTETIETYFSTQLIDTYPLPRRFPVRKNLIAFLVLVMFALTIGCASSPKPVVINEYKMSSVHEDFPVPEQALEREATFGNPNIAEGAKYELENIGGEQGLYPPKAYLEEIRASG